MSVLPDFAATWRIPGQGHAAAVLQRAVCGDDPEVAHAWAFVGPPGVGQEQAARTLAAALNCPAPSRSTPPCGACSVCNRCLRGAFPSYFEFAPTGAQHRVDDVRDQWLRAASMSAVEGRWKVLRIVDADRMNDVAANAFLKGLEEPPPRTLWILDVADPDELPDTILSRCRTLRFAPWGITELSDAASAAGLVGDDAALAVRAAMGSPATLERLAAPGGLDDFRAHRQVLRRLRDEGPGHALVAARAIQEEVKRRTAALRAESKAESAALAELYGGETPRSVAKQIEERAGRRERDAKTAVIQAALDDVAAWCRDCLLVAAGGDARTAISADDTDGLRADAAALGAEGLLRAVDACLATRESLEQNVQVGLALEALFLDLSALTLRS